MKEVKVEQKENLTPSQENRINTRLRKTTKEPWPISGGGVRTLAEIISKAPGNIYKKVAKIRNR